MKEERKRKWKMKRKRKRKTGESDRERELAVNNTGWVSLDGSSPFGFSHVGVGWDKLEKRLGWH